VRSEEGVGTTFTLYLPRAVGEAALSLAATPVAFKSPPSRRILLVEDNEGVGEFARGLLEELGQQVCWAGNAQAALDILAARAADFDVVFSDVVMPGMSGVELAQRVAARWPHLKVILTSGYSHVIVEEGTCGFPLLQKPYSIDGLLGILRQAWAS
jgi:DNA-binding NtrC family response regulator